MTLKSALDVTASLAMILAGAAILYVNLGRSSPKKKIFNLPKDPVAIGQSAFAGSASASTVAIIYSDFHCPFCKRLALDILPSLRGQYVDRGQLTLVFKHFPIETLHPLAFRAAQIAECGRRSGRFWEVHDALFEAPKDYSEDAVRRLAVESKIEPSALLDCLTAPPTGGIQDDVREAEALGVASTPLVLIGRRTTAGTVVVERSIAGAQPLAQFESAIEAVIGGR
jgi:protein-disulfide isomerase